MHMVAMIVVEERDQLVKGGFGTWRLLLNKTLVAVFQPSDSCPLLAQVGGTEEEERRPIHRFQAIQDDEPVEQQGHGWERNWELLVQGTKPVGNANAFAHQLMEVDGLNVDHANFLQGYPCGGNPTIWGSAAQTRELTTVVPKQLLQLQDVVGAERRSHHTKLNVIF